MTVPGFWQSWPAVQTAVRANPTATARFPLRDGLADRDTTELSPPAGACSARYARRAATRFTNCEININHAICQHTNTRSSRKIVGISPAPDDGQWITYKEAARLLWVDKSTVSRWVQRGILKSNGKNGRARRVDKSSVLMKRQQDDDEATRREDSDTKK